MSTPQYLRKAPWRRQPAAAPFDLFRQWGSGALQIRPFHPRWATARTGARDLGTACFRPARRAAGSLRGSISRLYSRWISWMQPLTTIRGAPRQRGSMFSISRSAAHSPCEKMAHRKA